jgi:hypothetical protein
MMIPQHPFNLLADVPASVLVIGALALALPGAIMIAFAIFAWFRSPGSVSPLHSCNHCGRHYPESSGACPGCGEREP